MRTLIRLIWLAAAALCLNQTAAAQNSVTSTPRVLHLCAQHCVTFTYENGVLVNYTNLEGQSGVKRVLSIERFTPQSVIIHRVDYGSHPLSQIYTGRMGPGNNSLEGPGWKMTWGTGLADLPGSDEERAARARGEHPAARSMTNPSSSPHLPSVLHFCAQHCATFTLQGTQYVRSAGGANNGSNTVMTVEKFTPAAVIIHRTDTGTYPGTAVYSGPMTDGGNSLTGDGWKITWGAGLNIIPGTDEDREAMARGTWHPITPPATDLASNNPLPRQAQGPPRQTSPQAQPQPQPQTPSPRQAQAQPRPTPPTDNSGHDSDFVNPATPEGAWVPHARFALVIGNSHYAARAGTNTNTPPWPDLEGGPLKDADAISASLRALGFEVTEMKDQNLDQMNADLRAFAERIAAAPDSLAIFYFSGHGTQAPRGAGEDGDDAYVIPTGTDLQWDVDAHSKAIALTEIRNALRHSKAAVVILDACRNNALRRPATRSAATRGLGAPASVSGMLVAYSTPAGEVADNRAGQPSQYTQLLAKDLGQRGQSLTSIFRSVRNQIAQLNGSRLPVLTDELNNDIVLVPR